jgi:Tol biopolymer transport system component
VVHPNGKTIAFRGYPSGSANSQIYTVSIDGGKPAVLVKESVSVDAPAWSPDGTKLIFSMNPQPDTSVGLYVLDMNTGAIESASQILGKGGWTGERGVRDLQVKLKPPDVRPSNLQTHR